MQVKRVDEPIASIIPFNDRWASSHLGVSYDLAKIYISEGANHGSCRWANPFSVTRSERPETETVAEKKAARRGR